MLSRARRRLINGIHDRRYTNRVYKYTFLDDIVL